MSKPFVNDREERAICGIRWENVYVTLEEDAEKRLLGKVQADIRNRHL